MPATVEPKAGVGGQDVIAADGAIKVDFAVCEGLSVSPFQCLGMGGDVRAQREVAVVAQFEEIGHDHPKPERGVLPQLRDKKARGPFQSWIWQAQAGHP